LFVSSLTSLLDLYYFFMEWWGRCSRSRGVGLVFFLDRHPHFSAYVMWGQYLILGAGPFPDMSNPFSESWRIFSRGQKNRGKNLLSYWINHMKHNYGTERPVAGMLWKLLDREFHRSSLFCVSNHFVTPQRYTFLSNFNCGCTPSRRKIICSQLVGFCVSHHRSLNIRGWAHSNECFRLLKLSGGLACSQIFHILQHHPLQLY
jgi:hypothetical protein